MKPPLLAVVFLGRCPKCAEGQLFNRLLELKKSCIACRYDYSKLKTDDGAAAFVTLFIGIIIAPIIFLLEFYVHPSYWLYLVFGLPFLFVITIYCQRMVKAALIYMQFNYIS